MAEAVWKSKRVALTGGVGAAALVVAQGRIVAVAAHDAHPPARAVHDLGDRLLLPGLVDTHVHLNEPGRANWEGFATGTRAALAGGITTVVDMPLNCLPETTTADALRQKRAAAEGKAHTDWRAWGGVVGSALERVEHNRAHLEPLARAGAAGFKCFLLYPGCDGFGQVDAAELRLAAPVLARLGLPLLVHAELPAPLLAARTELAGADWRRYSTYLASRPDRAETEAVALLLGLQREFGFALHIVHVSSAAVLPMLRAARAEGLPVTAETCPHYLHAAAEEIADGATAWKCAPPIRSAANRELLWQALTDGTLDLIASDHSPCPPELKAAGAGDFGQSWGGIASLALGAAIVWTGMQRRGLSDADGPARLARWMAAAPAALAGLRGRKGTLAPGADADFAVFDPNRVWQVITDDLHTRHPLSPYLGQTLQGRIEQTVLRGETAYLCDGAGAATFPGPARGREVQP